MKPSQNTTRDGLLLGLTAYGIWGLFPLFFHQLAAVNPIQVLLHRIVWSCLFVAVLLLIRGRWHALTAPLKQPALFRPMAFAALLIGANWLIFIYAVTSKQVLAASLGYFITPLVSVVLAVLFLGESLSRARIVALLLALAGIVWRMVEIGGLPWISLSLALTFGTYGLVRKQAPIDSLPGLFLETLLLLPAALLLWLWLGLQGASQFLAAPNITLLLLLSGVVTALPLLAFAAAAKRLSLMTLGFMMYLNPTLQFLTATLLFEEPFERTQLVSFLLVWSALAVFSFGAGHPRKQPD